MSHEFEEHISHGRSADQRNTDHRGGFRRSDSQYADAPVRRRSGDDGELIDSLHRLDGRSYGGYKSLIGDWDYGKFSLAIDRVQPDPYAPPSAVRASAQLAAMGLPEDCYSTPDQRLATADYLVRTFERNIKRFAHPGVVNIARAGQEVLQRSACTVSREGVEVRFQVQFPARGRTILGQTAATIFDRDVPDIVLESFDFYSDEVGKANLSDLRNHVHAYEDYRALSSQLASNGWITFVADNSVLARRSGISQSPMGGAVPFESPETLRVTVDLPHAGQITGMALRPGITVIVGGGYHGKSTLLSAIERGVYAHIPGDGRELVATAQDAVKVRAADGRAVTNVDVSPFISHLPGGSDTSAFSTENASGSTSQAAAIMEAVELGSPLLLIDEDTSATNLLIRDARMRELVHAEKEPITPLVDRIGALNSERHVSTVMVMGGSGDYLDVAHTVLMMDTYRCVDVTDRAADVVAHQPRMRTDSEDFGRANPRIPMHLRSTSDRPRTKVLGPDRVQIDKKIVDLADVAQIVDQGQTEAIGFAIRGVLEYLADGTAPLPELLDRLEAEFAEKGLDALTRFGGRQHAAFLVRPRRVDIGAAINRFRGLEVSGVRAVQNENQDENENENQDENEE